MSDSERVPGDRALLWFNVIGIAVAAGLFGTFFWNYGNGFLEFMMVLFGHEPFMP